GSLPWSLMGLLADEAIDAGEPWLAAGWSWLAEQRKFPFPAVDGKYHTYWAWIRGDNPVSAYQLPIDVPSSGPGRDDTRWRSPGPAFLAAAQAMGEWLRLEDQRERAKAQEATLQKLRSQKENS